MSRAPERAHFRGWLLAQIDRDDPVGDLARDAAIDTCWTTIGWRRFVFHIANEHGATDRAVDAARQARAEYRDWRHGRSAA